MKTGIWLGLMMLCCLIAGSCKKSFLSTAPLAELSAAELKEKDGVEKVIIGAYSVLKGQIDHDDQAFHSPASNWTFGDVTSDDALKGGNGTGDLNSIHKMETFVVDAYSIDAQRKWMVCYEGVSRANQAINLLKVANGYEEVLRSQRIAEMRFLRGHFYFELKKIFNKIPYIDENVAREDMVKISNVTLNDDELWKKIEDDFMAASQHLPKKQLAEPGRPTRYAAFAYLCKSYIFQKKWMDAIITADTVITRGGYSLMPNYADVFLPEYDNGPEIIFAVQHSINDGVANGYNGSVGDRLFPIGGPYWPAAEFGFFRPTQDLVNHFKTDEMGLPLKNNQDLSKNDFVDPRLDHTIARKGIPFLDLPVAYDPSWVRDYETYGGYSIKKRLVSPLSGHWLKVAPYTNDLNYYVIRYADVLLWQAEAFLALGHQQPARQLINQLRRRARDGKKVQFPGGGDAANYRVEEYATFFDCQECAMEALKTERRLEFALEGHRFFDLVRWGDASTVLKAYLKGESAKKPYLLNAKFLKGKHEYQPIPQREIDLSKGVLVQNPGY
jgi:hypothetical protein